MCSPENRKGNIPNENMFAKTFKLAVDSWQLAKSWINMSCKMQIANCKLLKIEKIFAIVIKKIPSFILLCSITTTSCNIINPAEPIPAYVKVDSFSFAVTDSIVQG